MSATFTPKPKRIQHVFFARPSVGHRVKVADGHQHFGLVGVISSVRRYPNGELWAKVRLPNIDSRAEIELPIEFLSRIPSSFAPSPLPARRDPTEERKRQLEKELERERELQLQKLYNAQRRAKLQLPKRRNYIPTKRAANG